MSAEPTLTPQELKAILDLAATANAPVGAVFQAHDILLRAARLAAGTRPIGGVEIPAVETLPGGRIPSPWPDAPPWDETGFRDKGEGA
jgi:hypothetical protein